MIFCYEKNDELRRIMLAILANRGFEYRAFSDTKELFAALDVQKPMLVVMDSVGVDGEDNGDDEYLREVCMEKRIPVLKVLLKMNTLNDIALHGEYFVHKPFSASEFIDGVNHALNRHGSDREEFTFGRIAVYEKERRVEVGGEEVILTNKEYELLRFLFENPDRVFSREQLFSCIWGSDFMGSSRTVDVHIGTLRNKLKGAGEYIKTVRGKGYLASEIQ